MLFVLDYNVDLQVIGKKMIFFGLSSNLQNLSNYTMKKLIRSMHVTYPIGFGGVGIFCCIRYIPFLA